MSRHHVVMIAQPSATAFLAGASRRETRAAKTVRMRSNRGAATAADDLSEQLIAVKAPALTRWVDRRAMKRTGN